MQINFSITHFGDIFELNTNFTCVFYIALSWGGPKSSFFNNICHKLRERVTKGMYYFVKAYDTCKLNVLYIIWDDCETILCTYSVRVFGIF